MYKKIFIKSLLLQRQFKSYSRTMKNTFLLFIAFSFIVVGAQKGLMRSRDLMSMVTRKLANEDLEAACTLADSWCAFEGMGNGVNGPFFVGTGGDRECESLVGQTKSLVQLKKYASRCRRNKTVGKMKNYIFSCNDLEITDFRLWALY